MNEHFCEEHQVVFFKTSKMQKYAHPIEGTKGEDGKSKWCNMPEEPAEHPSTYESVPLVKEAVNMGAEVVSVTTKPPSDPKNRSFALAYAKDIAVAKMATVGGEMSVDKVIEIAKKFAQYLDTGE